ncbi:hypothetical protein I603_1354 [Erythrobacter dokdonensis DSW-74]|uniref:Uncharacterized protein n=1 Tax=Erythrobacter dokdonensis DSW-74 TaxID=1300349 RepID=A0A1A7BGV3_9SPHN|nr:hypothetical protein I603_1354 [Erythrobacter dokdonensis DSW-74]
MEQWFQGVPGFQGAIVAASGWSRRPAISTQGQYAGKNLSA